jgi:hypothetical protein
VPSPLRDPASGERTLVLPAVLAEGERAMNPRHRARLVRLWRLFAAAVAEAETDTDGSVGAYYGLHLLHLARYRYLRGLVSTGLLASGDSLPSDDFLWEIHPANFAAEWAALIEENAP